MIGSSLQDNTFSYLPIYRSEDARVTTRCAITGGGGNRALSRARHQNLGQGLWRLRERRESVDRASGNPDGSFAEPLSAKARNFGGMLEAAGELRAAGESLNAITKGKPL